MRIKPPLLARTSPSLFLSGTAILADQDHPSWMMKREVLGFSNTLLEGVHDKVPRKPSWPPETEHRPQEQKRGNQNCDCGHLGLFHTSPSPSGGTSHPFKKKPFGHDPDHATSISTQFELKVATSCWAPCAFVSDLLDSSSS